MKPLTILLLLLALWMPSWAQSGKKVRRTASNTKEAVTERQISSRFNSGLRAYYTAQYDEAMQVFSSILAEAPKHAPSHFMLARVYSGRQQFAEAENAFKQAIKLDKENIWYQVGLADFYQHVADYKSALPYWEKICQKYPDNEAYLLNLQMCYSTCKMDDKAAETRMRLEQLTGRPTPDPAGQTETAGNGSSKEMGMASLKAGRYAEAVSTLNQALNEDDTDYDLWKAFADAVDKSQQWQMLTAREDDLATLFPQSAEMLANLANAFLKSANPEKAVEYYKQAKAFSFDDALTQRIRKGLHDAYTALGDTENAERWR